MSLRIVYGRAGSGKSEFCLNEIGKNMKDDNYPTKMYLITPEQFSFTAEKRLMEICRKYHKKAILQAEVLTFERMAYRVMQDVGEACTTKLSSTGKAMIAYEILTKNKKKLTFLGKNDENVELVCKTITELKKHHVDSKQVKDIIVKVESPYLQSKMEDIALVYQEFQNMILDSYMDENDTLTLLEKQLEQTNLLENSEFFLDEFAGFTPQEYEIIRILMKVGKRVTITVCSDNMGEADNPDKDVFYDNKKTIQKLKKIALEEGIEQEEDICLFPCYRFQNKELQYLERNLYALHTVPYQENVENIKLYLAKNPYAEVEFIAEQIYQLVKEKGFYYRDIAVIVKNIDTYSSLVKAIFSQYDIPVFIDEKKDLSENLLVRYILSILEIFTHNWSYEAVFSYLKTGFMTDEIELEEIFKLENYCMQWAIKGNKWYQEDWQYGKFKQTDEKQIERFNQIRRRMVLPLIALKKQMQEAVNVREMTKSLYAFLLQAEIDKQWKSKIQQLESMGMIELAKEYQTSWNIILAVLDEMVMIFGEKKLSFEKYAELLKIGLKNSDLGKIPATQDEVILGNIDRSRSQKVKAIFILGMNDGVFPASYQEEGFLNDTDRTALKDLGVELAKTSLEKIYEDNFNGYRAFTTAEQKLFLSYVSSDFQGTPLRASIWIGKVKKLFPKLIEESDCTEKEKIISTLSSTFDALIENIENLKRGENIEEIWYDVWKYYEENPVWKERIEKSIQGIFYTNMPENISLENTQKLYGEFLKTSVSKLEQYQSCPFSFFLKYGLKLSEQETLKMKPIDTGTFMHEVIDAFFEQIQQYHWQVKEITEEQEKEIVDNIIEEKLALNKNYIFTSTPKFRVLTKRLKKVVTVSIHYILETLRVSDFSILGNEVEFGEKGNYPSVHFTLEDGKAVEIIGKVDRIDIAKLPQGNYIRIIDYKSSMKDIDLNEVMAGLQIQLLTYLDMACQAEDVLPAGALYFNLKDPLVKASRQISEEKIAEELKKQFKMNGLLLADVQVLKRMDYTIENEGVNTIPVYIGKNGEISKAKSNVVTKQEFEALQIQIQKIIKQISKEILKGDIGLKPYYHLKTGRTPCEYCVYRSICQFQKGFCQNKYRYVKKDSKESILESIKGEKNA